MPTLQELLRQKAAIDNEIARARSQSRANAIDLVLSTMNEAGLTIQDVEGALRQSKYGRDGVRRPVAPKYLDAETGATWTGRGLKPKWLVAALATGRSLESFAI
jgi:DNA-binding protein H-NS